MAFLSEEERAAIEEDGGFKAVTEATITDPARMACALREIRDRGYAITRGQRIPGAVGLAAPIFGPNGDVLGDIATSIPEQYFDKASERRIARLVLQCAIDTTTEIGGKAPIKDETHKRALRRSGASTVIQRRKRSKK
jgi:DNA-binding IclR family transcriptional regulator